MPAGCNDRLGWSWGGGGRVDDRAQAIDAKSVTHWDEPRQKPALSEERQGFRRDRAALSSASGLSRKGLIPPAIESKFSDRGHLLAMGQVAAQGFKLPRLGGMGRFEVGTLGPEVNHLLL